MSTCACWPVPPLSATEPPFVAVVRHHIFNNCCFLLWLLLAIHNVAPRPTRLEPKPHLIHPHKSPLNFFVVVFCASIDIISCSFVFSIFKDYHGLHFFVVRRPPNSARSMSIRRVNNNKKSIECIEAEEKISTEKKRNSDEMKETTSSAENFTSIP